MLIRNLIAALVLSGALAVPMTIAHADGVARQSVIAARRMSVPFASAHDRNAVTLVLAESLLRVRLTRSLHLRCELSGHEELNADPEIRVNLGVHVRFH